jgi:hypothetical protein
VYAEHIMVPILCHMGYIAYDSFDLKQDIFISNSVLHSIVRFGKTSTVSPRFTKIRITKFRSHELL